MSSAKVSYNMSEHLAGEIREAVDYWLDVGTGSSAVYLGLFGVPLFQIGTVGSSTQLGGSGSNIITSMQTALSNIGKTIKSGAITFGTNLKQFGSRTRDWIEGSWSTVRKQASDAYHDVGGFVKSALSDGWRTLKTAGSKVLDIEIDAN